MRNLLFALGIAAVAIAAKLSLDSAEAHRRADSILYPRLVATMNEFALSHGGTADPGHYDKLDVKDIKRWHEVRDAWKQFDAAMKEAGY